MLLSPEGCGDVAELPELPEVWIIFLSLLYLSPCPQTPCFIFYWDFLQMNPIKRITSVEICRCQ